MIESDWCNCTDPEEMISFLRSKITRRKLSLLLCACFRRVEYLLTEDCGLPLVDAMERHADGLGTLEECHHFIDTIMSSAGTEADYVAACGAVVRDWRQVKEVLRMLANVAQTTTPLLHSLRNQSVLLRDIIGNPFHPVVHFDRTSLSSETLSLATAIYEKDTSR